MLPTTIFDLLTATFETLYMVGVAMLFTVLIGLPLATILFITRHIKPNYYIYKTLSLIINIGRSVPFIILLVALIPLTRFLVGTSIGINAAIVPLTIGAIPFFARLVENAYSALPNGLIEVGKSMSATPWQMIKYILLPEALSLIIQAITVTTIALIGYSAMAGTVGAGGLGDLAIRFGYLRFDITVMLYTVIILVVMVQLVQIFGDYMSSKCSRLS